MKRKNIFIGCMSAVFVPFLTNAQTTKTLSLNEAITMSLQNSKQLKINSAKIRQATAMVQEANERRLPNASVSGSYLRLASPNIKLASAKDSSGSSGNGPKVSQALYGILNVSLPIYSGNKIKFGIESAKYLNEAAKLDAENNKQDVIFNTMNAYTNLLKSEAAVAIVQENLNESNHRVTDFINLEKNGLLARNDLLKAQLQASNIELNLLEAINNRDIANVNMDLMLGLPEVTVLQPDSASLQTTPEVTVDELELQALQNRMDIKALSFRKKAAATEIKITKADYLPSLALTGGYIAAYVPHLLTITNAMNIGLGVQYNLSSLWKKGKLQEVKARVSEIEADQAQLDDAVRLQIHTNYHDYLLSLKKIKVYAKAVEQAEENYRISNNKYENSLLTTTELMEADVAQLQAKLNYAFAKTDSFLAYYKLLQTAGILIHK